MGSEQRSERSRLVISAAAQRSVRFAVATGLVIYEAVFFDGEPRWVLLAVYLTMMGLPIAERADELRRQSLDKMRAAFADEDEPT